MKLLRSHGWLAAIVLALAAAVQLLRATEAYEVVEFKTLDWRFRNFSRPQRADPRIVIANIDQQSLDHFEQVDSMPWPWPRSIYEPVVNFAKAGGARVVVIDLLFTNITHWGPGEDESLGRVLARSGIAVLDLDFGRRPEKRRQAPPPARFAVEIIGSTGAAVAAESLRLPVPELLRGAKRAGDVQAQPDADGVFRRVPLVTSFQGRFYPSVPLAVALEVLGEKVVRFEDGALVLGGRRLPLEDGRALLRFHGAALAPGRTGGVRTYETYSAKDLILAQRAIEEKRQPNLAPSLLKDKILFIGAGAPALMDNRPSPVSPVFPGTEDLAVAVDNLLNGDLLRRAPRRWVFALVLLAAALGSAAALSNRRFGVSIGLLAALAGALVVGTVAAFDRGIWIDLVAPEAALFLSFAVSAAYNYVVEGRERRY
ncbi:MAG: CHASE2 domain-containing protein, partial [Elusimicrobia bacterium]|nr:CHASE2 domain-containing protein [Elusimicrobiota bacterium]